MDNVNNVDLLEGVSQNAHFDEISQSQRAGREETQLAKSVRVYALLNSKVDQKNASTNVSTSSDKRPQSCCSTTCSIKTGEMETCLASPELGGNSEDLQWHYQEKVGGRDQNEPNKSKFGY
ncbi:hypothetical protein C2G38_2181904 [Gigaspora rosea]|uniref:Uncharacterized protein n=1 Tax=Gigaspora rosea TaxID=44941 RepID=A0A397VBM7_9GLOM|nr:hypothetical protein C2G38_2181904 [Gigaspora rosea]